MTGERGSLVVALREEQTSAELVVSGDVDLDTCEQFGHAIKGAIAGSSPVVVDLTGVRYLGSPGIHVLLEHRKRLHAVRVQAGSVVARSLALVELPNLVQVPVR